MSIPDYFGLGRLPAKDPQDAKFLMRAMLPEEPIRRSRYYWSGWFGDQGNGSSCVGFSWTHWLTAGPVTQVSRSWDPFARNMYLEAQKVDEWEGEDYEGTSVRAGAKVLQAKGFISEYRWAWTGDEVIRAVLDVGPVVVGTNWHLDMFFPDVNGFIKVGGPVEGGHAYLIDGANWDRKVVRIKNSWGRGWGRMGRGYMSFADLNMLMAAEGEAVLATELRA